MALAPVRCPDPGSGMGEDGVQLMAVAFVRLVRTRVLGSGLARNPTGRPSWAGPRASLCRACGAGAFQVLLPLVFAETLSDPTESVLFVTSLASPRSTTVLLPEKFSLGEK